MVFQGRGAGSVEKLERVNQKDQRMERNTVKTMKEGGTVGDAHGYPHILPSYANT